MRKRASAGRRSSSRKSGSSGRSGRRAKGALTVNEAGRKGGEITASRYGHEFYQIIGSQGGSTTADKYGGDHFEKIGRKGGKAPHEKRGLQAADKETREEVARKGGEARRGGLISKVKKMVHLD